MSNVNEYRKVLNKVGNAKKLGDRTPRPDAGNHTVVVTRYEPKIGERSKEIRFESDFMIARTDAPTLKVGDIRGWAWFPQSSGDHGDYERSRAREFNEAVLASISNVAELPHAVFSDGKTYPINPVENTPYYNEDGSIKTAYDAAAIGELLAIGYLRGLQLGVRVVQAIDKETNQPLKTKKNEPVLNAFWSPIPQTMADVLAMRAQLDAHASKAAPQATASAAPVAAPAPAVMPAAMPAPVPTPTPAVAAPQPAPQGAPIAVSPFAQPQGAPAQFAPTPAPVGAPAPVQPVGNIFQDLRK